MERNLQSYGQSRMPTIWCSNPFLSRTPKFLDQMATFEMLGGSPSYAPAAKSCSFCASVRPRILVIRAFFTRTPSSMAPEWVDPGSAGVWCGSEGLSGVQCASMGFSAVGSSWFGLVQCGSVCGVQCGWLSFMSRYDSVHTNKVQCGWLSFTSGYI